eukprot:6901606-Prymnesium_polylepis.2
MINIPCRHPVGVELRQFEHHLQRSRTSRLVNRQPPTVTLCRHPFGVELRQLEHRLRRPHLSREVDRQ